MWAGKKKKKREEKPFNSQGLVNRAGEVLGAQTGEEVWMYIWHERQQLDPEPELDEFGVLQVFLSQRWRIPLRKDLLKVRCQLCEVLWDRIGRYNYKSHS